VGFDKYVGLVACAPPGARDDIGKTSEPNAEWVTQQARNLSWKLADEGIRLGGLIHDRDKKFAPQADRVLQSQGARVILTPLMAPMANAYAERWIGSCRRECLDLDARRQPASPRNYPPRLLPALTTKSARIGAETFVRRLPAKIACCQLLPRLTGRLDSAAS